MISEYDSIHLNYLALSPSKSQKFGNVFSDIVAVLEALICMCFFLFFWRKSFICFVYPFEYSNEIKYMKLLRYIGTALQN